MPKSDTNGTKKQKILKYYTQIYFFCISHMLHNFFIPKQINNEKQPIKYIFEVFYIFTVRVDDLLGAQYIY